MVTLKSGKRVRRTSDSSSNAPSSSAPNRPAAGSRLRSTTDSDSSLPDIPPLASKSTSANVPVVVDICEDEPPPSRENEEESDEEGPDYEPVWKRAKPGQRNERKTAATKPPTRKSEALVVLYDLTEDAEEDDDDDVHEESDDDEDGLAEVTFVNVTSKAEQTVVVIDDDDDEEDAATADGEESPDAPGVAANEVSASSTLVTPAAETQDDTPTEDATTTETPEIIVDNVENTPSGGESPRKRQPVTAHVEEIVPKKYRTLYFSFSSSRVTDDQLWTLFTQFGEIESLRIEDDPATTPRHEGHVVFKKFYAIDGCVKAKPLSVGITNIEIRRTPEKAEENQHVDTIYVSGIYHLASIQLEQYFSSFGQIKEVKIFPARGFAFVQFEDSDSVDKTLLQHYHIIQGLLLEVKRSFKKNPAPKPRPSQFAVPRPPKYDKGPRGRASTSSLSVTPFPRHVDMKLKLDPGASTSSPSPVPFDRCSSASSGSIDNHQQVVVKTEPIKTERG